MTCTTCQQLITLLNSQKNGNYETCLNCAINQAPKVRYVLKRRSEVIHDDIVCQRHYQEDAQPGHYMQPLTDREKVAGYERIVTPYDGERVCETCEEQAERKAGAA